MGHFVVMTRQAAIALSGPPVVAAAIGEELTADELGGPKVSSEQSGNAHLVVEDEPAAIAAIQRVLGYLPDSADHPAPSAPAAPPTRDAEQLLTLVPSDPRRGYDMRKVLDAIVDANSIQPWAERYGAQRPLLLRPDRGRGRRRGGEPAPAAGRRPGRAGADQGSRRSSTSATRSTCRSSSCRMSPA